jgi:hypothetical protein
MSKFQGITVLLPQTYTHKNRRTAYLTYNLAYGQTSAYCFTAYPYITTQISLSANSPTLRTKNLKSIYQIYYSLFSMTALSPSYLPNRELLMDLFKGPLHQVQRMLFRTRDSYSQDEARILYYTSEALVSHAVTFSFTTFHV